MEKHPDYSGKITLDNGQVVCLSDRVNEEKKTDEKYLSQQGKHANEQAARPAIKATVQNEDDRLPF